MSIWRSSVGRRQKPAVKPPPQAPDLNTHSLIAGNGHHYLVPPRTGGIPWIGHMGRSPEPHPFAPAETFSPGTGGYIVPSTAGVVATVPAVVNSMVGQATGTIQLAPGGGVNMPAVQR